MSTKSVRSILSSKGTLREDDIPVLSQEDKLRAMLGHKDTSGGTLLPYLYREDFCGCCGTQLMNPNLIDNYYTCQKCFNTLREPSKLRKKYEGVPNTPPLQVIFATYGDPYNSSAAIDVTEKCKEKLQEFQSLDRITFKSAVNLERYFGIDPVPGKNRW